MAICLVSGLVLGAILFAPAFNEVIRGRDGR